jgi:UTP--glucose-1-phosphate uridylyltransferase
MLAGYPQSTVKRAVIAAAGRGTRLLPLTRITPKPLLPVLDRPLVDHAIGDAMAAGISEVFVLYNSSTFQQWKEVQDAYQLTGWEHIHFVAVQANGHHWGESLLELEDKLENEPFALLLASELFEHGGSFLAEMISTFEETHCATIAINHHGSEDDVIPLKSVKEACAKDITLGTDRSRFLGRYILPPDFLRTLRQTASDDGKVTFYSALNRTAHDGKLLGLVCRNRHWAIRLPLDYLLATVDFAVEDFEYGPMLRRHLEVALSDKMDKGSDE